MRKAAINTSSDRTTRRGVSGFISSCLCYRGLAPAAAAARICGRDDVDAIIEQHHAADADAEKVLRYACASN